jgi:hypothetical protein
MTGKYKHIIVRADDSLDVPAETRQWYMIGDREFATAAAKLRMSTDRVADAVMKDHVASEATAVCEASGLVPPDPQMKRLGELYSVTVHGRPIFNRFYVTSDKVDKRLYLDYLCSLQGEKPVICKVGWNDVVLAEARCIGGNTWEWKMSSSRNAVNILKACKKNLSALIGLYFECDAKIVGVNSRENTIRVSPMFEYDLSDRRVLHPCQPDEDVYDVYVLSEDAMCKVDGKWLDYVGTKQCDNLFPVHVVGKFMCSVKQLKFTQWV